MHPVVLTRDAASSFYAIQHTLPFCPGHESVWSDECASPYCMDYGAERMSHGGGPLAEALDDFRARVRSRTRAHEARARGSRGVRSEKDKKTKGESRATVSLVSLVSVDA